MNKLIREFNNELTTTTTENGDKTYSTSLNACVDLFFQSPAMRSRKNDPAYINLVVDALNENPVIATKIMFWLRDVRGGAGERDLFRTFITNIADKHDTLAVIVMNKIAEVGRFDDLLFFKNHEPYALQTFVAALQAGNPLAAKWAPREKSKKFPGVAEKLRLLLGLSKREYRKMITYLSTTVEQKMCANEWDEIEFSHVPSVASARYGKAFSRHDPERYTKYIEDVQSGKTKINAGAIYPYDVLKAQSHTADVMWNALPDFVPEGLSFMPLIDVSGSMNTPVSTGTTAMNVAVSVGLYLAERNKSVFKDYYITFSSEPKLKKVKGSSVYERVYNVKSDEWGMSTNLDAAMNLILDAAVSGNVPQSDLPNSLIVLSDMEFNGGGGYYIGANGNTSVSERTKAAFNHAGYEMPNIVWWNINSRNGTTPARFDETGMALVGGASPAVVKNIMGGSYSPIEIMTKAIDDPRYEF